MSSSAPQLLGIGTMPSMNDPAAMIGADGETRLPGSWPEAFLQTAAWHAADAIAVGEPPPEPEEVGPLQPELILPPGPGLTLFEVSEPTPGNVLAQASASRQRFPFNLVIDRNELAAESVRLGCSSLVVVPPRILDANGDPIQASRAPASWNAGQNQLFGRSAEIAERPYGNRLSGPSARLPLRSPIQAAMDEYAESFQRTMMSEVRRLSARDLRLLNGNAEAMMATWEYWDAERDGSTAWDVESVDAIGHAFDEFAARLLQYPVEAASGGVANWAAVHDAIDAAAGRAAGTTLRLQTGFTDSANDRAEELLLRHLSPAQAEEYRHCGAFSVVGGTTGHSYRIHGRRQVNVVNETTGRALCLVTPSTPLGDQLLAQKLLLESAEDEFRRTAIDWSPVDRLFRVRYCP